MEPKLQTIETMMHLKSNLSVEKVLVYLFACYDFVDFESCNSHLPAVAVGPPI